MKMGRIFYIFNNVMSTAVKKVRYVDLVILISYYEVIHVFVLFFHWEGREFIMLLNL